MLFVETPTNPVMRLTDLAAAADLAHRHDVRLVVDNTFASPYIQRPIEFGADLVVHSTTNYLNGHSDSVGGIVVAVRDDDIEWLTFVQNAEGAILGRSIRGWCCAAPRRCRCACSSTTPPVWRSPSSSSAHPKVQRVYYPGLPTHPQHELAEAPDARLRRHARVRARVARGGGAVGQRRCGSTQLAESLGGVETLISHPATMTHASVPPERRAAIGITDGMVRISAGLEDLDDLQGRSVSRRSTGCRLQESTRGRNTWHHRHGKSPASITRRAAATSSVPASSHNCKPSRAKARAPSR